MERSIRHSFTARAAGLALVAIVVLPAPASVAAGAVRQTSRFLFDTRTPNSGTGVRVAIDYVNPDDAAAKPYAVQTVIERLAKGARIDTSVPERCTASDSELMAQGAAACPAGSLVGNGEVDLDTGAPGPGRIIHTEVTEFNNEGELVLLFEQDGGGPRVVSRAPIEDGGRAIRAEAPPLPGGPPDGYTALKRVRITLDPVTVVSGGVRRNYVTTPRTCPASGAWTNSVSFTYRDGESQTVRSSSACRRPRHPRPPEPRIRILGVPRDRCASEPFVARVRIENMARLRRVRLRLDGKTIRQTQRRRFSERVAVGPRAVRHRLTVVAQDVEGRLKIKRVRFRGCG